MKVINEHRVPNLQKSSRLSDYLVGVFVELPSRKSVKKAIQRGEVWVNEKVAGTGHWVETGQQIQLLENTQSLPKVLELKIPIVYEDDYLAVLNKPAGLVVSGNQYRTVQNALLFNLKPSLLPDALRLPRPVHRLDAATSGLLLVAKTANTVRDLSTQFANKTIKKRYRAIVAGATPAEGTITQPIDNQLATSLFIRIQKSPSLKNKWVTLLD
ncbi:MAG: pseudouridine synthase, partial [Saprospiraceae bacterium]